MSGSSSASGSRQDGSLAGYRVLDLSTVVAGPVIARNLGDHGAEVVKVEHPRHGDPARRMGWQVGGESLWWKTLSRNKLPVTCDLSHPRGGELCLELAATCDVIVESFRPGTLERWGLGPDELFAVNPDLIVVRVSGFGQDGPYAPRPGFGTLAEAMSGWAGMQGVEGGPPQLPAAALADETAAAAGTTATVLALLHRERTRGAGSPSGQVIDVSLYEPLMAIIGPLPALYEATGEEAPRLGNRLPFAAPRGAYRCSDGRWLALSGSSPAVARRILAAVGGEALADDPRYASNAGRLTHAGELDAIIAAWAGEHTLDEAMEELAGKDAAAAPVYRMADLLADPHVRARSSVVRVPDPALGTVAMAAVTPRMSRTPGTVRWAGRPAGDANAQVYGEMLRKTQEELAALAEAGVI